MTSISSQRNLTASLIRRPIRQPDAFHKLYGSFKRERGKRCYTICQSRPTSAVCLNFTKRTTKGPHVRFSGLSLRTSSTAILALTVCMYPFGAGPAHAQTQSAAARHTSLSSPQSTKCLAGVQQGQSWSRHRRPGLKRPAGLDEKLRLLRPESHPTGNRRHRILDWFSFENLRRYHASADG